MKEFIYLALGICVLSLVIYDFFYTTLSSSGASFLSSAFLKLAHNSLNFSSKFFGRVVFKLSGMVVNLILLFMWIILVWVGLFLIFSFNPEGIMDVNGRVANHIERLYYTGYVLSTLGLGDFEPKTSMFKILTSIFSFYGFIFFTTSMSYLLSISSAVLHKSLVALSIRNFGEYPREILQNILQMDEGIRTHQILALQQMLDKHIINHKAYPALHFYNTANERNSYGRNIAVLDEAISILYSSSSTLNKHQDISQLRTSITNYIEHLEKEYGLLSDVTMDIQWEDLNLPKELTMEGFNVIDTLNSRRKVLAGLLKAEKLSWKDIYHK